MAKTKEIAVYGYSIRFGKDPDDPDSEKGWRVCVEDGAFFDASDVYEDQADAEEEAARLWAEQLAEEVADDVRYCDDVDTLNAIRKMLHGCNDDTLKTIFKMLESCETPSS
jgi:hypothetical protein